MPRSGLVGVLVYAVDIECGSWQPDREKVVGSVERWFDGGTIEGWRHIQYHQPFEEKTDERHLIDKYYFYP